MDGIGVWGDWHPVCAHSDSTHCTSFEPVMRSLLGTRSAKGRTRTASRRKVRLLWSVLWANEVNCDSGGLDRLLEVPPV